MTFEQQEQVACPDCNGSGEMETGIGMFPCDSCHGSCVKESLTVEAAVLAEREACAKVCDELYKHERKESGYDEGWNDALDIAEQAIRARGK